MFYLALINGRPRSNSAFGLFAATTRQETLFVIIYTRQETLFVIIYTRKETLFVIIYTNTDYKAINVNDRPEIYYIVAATYNWISESFIYLAYTDHSKWHKKQWSQLSYYTTFVA